MNEPYRIGAGMAQIVVTPDMFPYGFGRGPGFTGIHDELYVRALLLERGETRVLLITVDLDSFGHIDEWKQKIQSVIHVPEDGIFVMHTHNHESIHVRNDKDDAPEGDADTARSEALTWAAMVQAIRQAEERLQPGKIRYGTGLCDVNINREYCYEGYYMIGRSPQGPSDKTVAVLTFTDLEDRPLAFFINYAVHGSVMADVRGEDGNPIITGDLPGYTSRFVEAHYPGAVALWTSGAAGNQDAKYRATRQFLDAEGALRNYSVGAGGWALLDMQSRDLAEEVIRVADAGAENEELTGLSSVQTALTVPGKMKAGQGGPHGGHRPKGEPGGPGGPEGPGGVPCEGKMMKDIDINHADGDPVTVHVGLLALGNTALVCYSGEATYELGKQVQAALGERFEHVVVVTHCNGYIGYMSQEEGFDRRTRSALVSLLARGQAERVVVDTPLALAEGL